MVVRDLDQGRVLSEFEDCLVGIHSLSWPDIKSSRRWSFGDVIELSGGIQQFRRILEHEVNFGVSGDSGELLISRPSQDNDRPRNGVVGTG